MIKFCNETDVGLIAVRVCVQILKDISLTAQQYAPLSRRSLARPLSQYGYHFLDLTVWFDPRHKTGHSEADKEIIKRVGETAQKRDWTMTQVALAWIIRRVTSPIVGINNVARLVEAVGITGKVLTAEE